MVEIQDGFTYVSDAHHSTSWLDHIVCSHDIYYKLTLIKIHDKLPSSDHLPSSACIDIPLMPPCSFSRKSLRMTFNWAKASDVDLCSYDMHTFQNFKNIPINCAIKCDYVNCSSAEHRQMNDLFNRRFVARWNSLVRKQFLRVILEMVETISSQDSMIL